MSKLKYESLASFLHVLGESDGVEPALESLFTNIANELGDANTVSLDITSSLQQEGNLKFTFEFKSKNSKT